MTGLDTTEERSLHDVAICDGVVGLAVQLPRIRTFEENLMKHFALAATVLALGMFSTRSHAQDTGVDLQEECQVALSPNTAGDYQKAAHCFGYVSGAAFAITMWEGTNKEKHLGLEDVPACLPKNGTNHEYVRVVLHYLDEHPNKLHESYGILVFLALRDAYPCH